ncbi:MAG: adenosylmethionine decarboxylase [Elusimicrobia bacterium]|nr:adenosylmethionine decarboxylase [Elusimicrobiota bacterium]
MPRRRRLRGRVAATRPPSAPKRRHLGRHLLLDLYSCDRGVLSDVSAVEHVLVAAAKATGARVVDVVFHAFSPHGVSGVVVIAESHLSIHTWPEFRFASVDIFTCGTTVDPWKARAVLRRGFKAKRVEAQEIGRGAGPY